MSQGAWLKSHENQLTNGQHIMFNVLRQFDQAYAHFKGQLGEPRGISHEKGAALMDEARKITMAFSEFTGQLSKQVRFKYLCIRS
jgi:hypothetical protein